MEEKIIAELNDLLAKPESSTAAILNKAIQLAEFNGEDEFCLLFTYHLSGVSKAKTEELSKTKPNILSMFSSDRMISGESSYRLDSLVSLEKSIQHSEKDIEHARLDLDRIKASEGLYPSSAHRTKEMIALSVLGSLRTQESQIEEIISKIRNRVASFVGKEERKFLKAQAEKMGSITMGNKVFIGHGHSQVWRDLKDFLQDRLGLLWEEYNREPTAGMAIKERLEEMLGNSCFAFLVMTAEDEHANQSLHARENVIHEVGLFQGKLGFKKAIVLPEEGCQEFSNIHGLSQIRFPIGNVMARSEEIRRILEREGIL